MKGERTQRKMRVKGEGKDSEKREWTKRESRAKGERKQRERRGKGE